MNILAASVGDFIRSYSASCGLWSLLWAAWLHCDCEAEIILYDSSLLVVGCISYILVVAHSKYFQKVCKWDRSGLWQEDVWGIRETAL
jgi:hypothetical protein